MEYLWAFGMRLTFDLEKDQTNEGKNDQEDTWNQSQDLYSYRAR
jgi:hypothetical protein